jgi:hypothetical protein
LFRGLEDYTTYSDNPKDVWKGDPVADPQVYEVYNDNVFPADPGVIGKTVQVNPYMTNFKFHGYLAGWGVVMPQETGNAVMSSFDITLRDKSDADLTGFCETHQHAGKESPGNDWALCAIPGTDMEHERKKILDKLSLLSQILSALINQQEIIEKPDNARAFHECAFFRRVKCHRQRMQRLLWFEKHWFMMRFRVLRMTTLLTSLEYIRNTYIKYVDENLNKFATCGRSFIVPQQTDMNVTGKRLENILNVKNPVPFYYGDKHVAIGKKGCKMFCANHWWAFYERNMPDNKTSCITGEKQEEQGDLFDCAKPFWEGFVDTYTPVKFKTTQSPVYSPEDRYRVIYAILTRYLIHDNIYTAFKQDEESIHNIGYTPAYAADIWQPPQWVRAEGDVKARSFSPPDAYNLNTNVILSREKQYNLNYLPKRHVASLYQPGSVLRAT